MNWIGLGASITGLGLAVTKGISKSAMSPILKVGLIVIL